MDSVSDGLNTHGRGVVNPFSSFCEVLVSFELIFVKGKYIVLVFKNKVFRVLHTFSGCAVHCY